MHRRVRADELLLLGGDERYDNADDDDLSATTAAPSPRVTLPDGHGVALDFKLFSGRVDTTMHY